MTPDLVIGCVLALGLLYWWVRDQHIESEKRRKEREERCPHKDEWWDTIRVNRHPYNVFIPGYRYLVKKCRGCGRQKNMYAPTLKPWDEFLAEYRRETVDRKREFDARKREHDMEIEHRKRKSS